MTRAAETPRTQPDRGDRGDPRTPAVHVVSTLDFEAGVRHGAWLDAAREPADLARAIAGVLDASPTAAAQQREPEGWQIRAWRGFGFIALHDHEDLGFLSRTACGIRAHGLAYSGWVEIVGDDADEDSYRRAFRGHYRDFTHYTDSQLTHRPESLRMLGGHLVGGVRGARVDYGSGSHELRYRRDIYTADAPTGGIYVYAAD